MPTLIEQVAEATATTGDGEHLIQMDYTKFIRSEGRTTSVQQASGYLATGEWVSVGSTCGNADCCRPDHLTTLVQAKEANDLRLVATHAATLADLYRRARSRGLVAARSEYGG